jgi:hypothetical protein
MYKNNNKLNVGDIILVHGGSFIARAIQYFMNIYRIRKGLPKRKLYNHVATVVNMWGSLYVAESDRYGVQVLPNAKAYVAKNDCLVLSFKKPLTLIEKDKWSKLASTMALEPHKYDFLNFIYQIKYVLTGQWSGPTGDKSKKRVYCSEFVAILMDEIRNCFGGRTWDKNPLDIELSNCLRIKNA